MDSDPVLPAQQINKVYSAKYLPLWLQALDRPEADFQRLAAETVAQAHIDGMPKMIEAKPALVRIVIAKETHPAARFAAARALIVLEAKDVAPKLFQVAQEYGANVRQLIEPALARWKHEPAYDIWRRRLTSAEVNHRDLVLALRCLGDAGDQSALPLLLTIMHATQRLDAERLTAARAAGQLQEAGLENHAGKLARASAPVIDRLCAAALLERHASEPAKTLLLALAADPEPSVATAALRRLNAMDTSLALPLVEKALQSPDSGVRRLVAAAYAAHPTAERIKALGKHLDDPHPGVRGLVREEFRRLAGDSQWNGPVRQSATEALDAESWRGQEQAALLLGALDHKPAAPRLIKLLDSPRGEVMIATAWALRKLSLPETLPALLKKASYLTDVRLRQRNFDELDYQGAHLFEAMGRMNYKPAEPLMRRYIAKNFTMGEYSRSAAIWSLGLLHAGTPDDSLAAQITARVTEPAVVLPPEMSRVRVAGAIALGKMKAKSQAKSLRDYALLAGVIPVYMAIRWSLREFNAEEIPPPPSATLSKGGWFLGPLDISETPEP
jgi:HEAT repeat protein